MQYKTHKLKYIYLLKINKLLETRKNQRTFCEKKEKEKHNLRVAAYRKKKTLTSGYCIRLKKANKTAAHHKNSSLRHFD